VSKKIYLINSFFGIAAGILLLFYFGLQIIDGIMLYNTVTSSPANIANYVIARQLGLQSVDKMIYGSIPWIIAGIIGIIFGVYELKKYRASK
jgi:hypothetical protein